MHLAAFCISLYTANVCKTLDVTYKQSLDLTSVVLLSLLPTGHAGKDLGGAPPVPELPKRRRGNHS